MCYSKLNWTISYFGFTVTGCISVSGFASSLVGIPIGITSSLLEFCAITAVIRKYKSKINGKN